MSATVLVEPDYAGHHFQSVAVLTEHLRPRGPVVLLTSVGALASEPAQEFLDGVDVEVREVFDAVAPPTAAMVAAVVAVCRETEVSDVVLLDADQALKRWWREAPRALRSLPRGRRPRVVFMLTRYPARARLTDRWLYRLKLPKAVLAVVSRANGSVQRVAGYAGRDDTSRGIVVKRTRDPNICLAHSRDRVALRERYGLPQDRRIVGVFGVMSERRNVPMIWEAMRTAGIDADLLLAGKQDDDVRAWVADLVAANPGRIHVHDDFLPNQMIDDLVACSDVAPIPLTNNGPSGIMGKAVAAGVPVVTAGSVVRAREVTATGCGVAAELSPESIGAALAQVLAVSDRPWVSKIPPATEKDYVEAMLGLRLGPITRTTPE